MFKLFLSPADSVQCSGSTQQTDDGNVKQLFGGAFGEVRPVAPVVRQADDQVPRGRRLQKYLAELAELQ